MNEEKDIQAFLRYLELELNRSLRTRENYEADLRRFAEYLGRNSGCSIAEAALSDLRGWIAEAASNGLAPATLRLKAQTLRSFFRWLNVCGRRTDNPAARLRLAKKPKPLPVFVEPAQMERVLGAHLATDPVKEMRNRLILELLYTTGLRRSELRELRDGDISADRREMRVYGKGGKTRMVPLADGTLEMIRQWQRHRDGANRNSVRNPDTVGTSISGNSPLFPGRGGEPLSLSTIYVVVREALASTTTARRSPHTLRHSFATAMLRGGADIVTVKEFLGHASLSSTQIYTHLDFKQLQADWGKAHPRGVGSNPGRERGATKEENLGIMEENDAAPD